MIVFDVYEGENIPKLNLADRVNLHFKIGNFVDIPFSQNEESIVKQIQDCETFEEDISSAEALYKYCKEEKKELEKIQKAMNEIEDEIESTKEESNKNWC